MDTRVAMFAHDALPKMNPILANGVCYEQAKGTFQYIRQTIIDGLASLPKDTVVLDKLEVLDPADAFRISIRLDAKGTLNANSSCDVSRDDVVMYRLVLKFLTSDAGWVPKIYHFNVPVLRKGNLISLRDTNYNMTPVVGDPIVDRAKSQITLIFPRMKNEVYREEYNYMSLSREGNWERRLGYLVWSKLHNIKDRKVADFKPHVGFPALSTYLCAKHGLRKVMSEYADIDDYHIRTERGIRVYNPSEFDPQEYVTLRSSAMASSCHPDKPNGKYPLTTSKQFIDQNLDGEIYIVVNREQLKESDIGLSVLMSVLSVSDSTTYPKHVSDEDFDGTSIWRQNLVKLYKPGADHIKGMVDIDNHLCSVDAYVDKTVRNRYADDGIAVDIGDVTNVLTNAIRIMNNPTIISDKECSDISSNKIMVLQYLLEDIMYDMNMLFYKVRNKINNNDGNLKASDMEPKRHDFRMAMNSCSALTKDAVHPEVSSFSKTTSNIVLASSCLQTMQSDRIPNNNGQRDVDMSSPSNHVDVSLASHASFLWSSKSNPTGKLAMNMYLDVNLSNYTISNSPEIEDELAEARNEILK